MPPFHVFTYRTAMLEDTVEEFAKDSRAHADQYLAVIEKAAKAAVVTCDTGFATSDYPYEAIFKADEERSCDLVMMASHGRRGVQGLLLGSETQKVLTHSRIPVRCIARHRRRELPFGDGVKSCHATPYRSRLENLTGSVMETR